MVLTPENFMIHRHRENFWAFTRPGIDFGLILLISNMIIHRSFTGPTHLLSANVRGPVSFTVSGYMYDDRNIVKKVQPDRRTDVPTDRWTEDKCS